MISYSQILWECFQFTMQNVEYSHIRNYEKQEYDTCHAIFLYACYQNIFALPPPICSNSYAVLC